MIQRRRSIWALSVPGHLLSQLVGFLPFSIDSESFRIIHEHFDEVLVKGVMASAPTYLAVHDQSCRDVDAVPNQAGERFCPRGLRVQKVLFSLFGKFGVLVVASQVREPRP